MEPIKKHVNQWRPYIHEAMNSKIDELEMLGYERPTKKELWECLEAKVWRKEKEKTLHQVVQDVLHLKDAIYMSYLTVEAQKQDDNLMESIQALTNKQGKGQ
ncbi:post-transcriptional regulator [Halalkalibacillus halophilus]|uniref:post-transcriptional regulator n=1 Tax=Halalkalibacillus halophilus TaxID=392827 RepID=UPI0004297900|nr:post-transcriptional regulator [Halalkalibacillus halophilus]